MNKFVKNVLLASSAFMVVTSCVHDDDYDLPPLDCNDRWEANVDIPYVKSLNDTDTPFEVTTESILDGYVVSSDETGNFFKTIVVQESAENPTSGLTLEVDLTDTYTKFPIGSRVLVDLNGLYVGKSKGTYKVGSTYEQDGEVLLGRMPETDALSKIALACDDIVEIVPTSYNSITEALDESNLNTLIRLENVQFQTAGNGETYYQEEGAFGGAYNRTVVDSEGNTIDLRTSSYADFAAEVLPDGSGSLTAVLSAYSNSNNVTPSTYQLFIRDTDDVNFDQPRVEIVDGEGPVGGTSASYASCVSEDFESYSVDLVSFDNYINYAYNGDRYWSVQNYSQNNFLQLSAYNSDATNDVYFIIPVDFDSADEFSFSYKMRYYNGDALKVYYSNEYQIGGAITGLQDITSDFDLSNTDLDDFSAAGTFDLSGVSGNGAIFFKYEGVDGGTTTTIQLDDISIVDLDNDDCESNGGNDGGNDGGNNNAVFSEGFENGISSAWTNLAISGDRTWVGRDYDGAYYAQNSAYSSGDILDMEAWLITPAIDFDAQTGEAMVLNIADAYSNGNPLKVYYSSDYSDGADPSTANWTEIAASEIGALPVNTGGYDNVYDATSAIDLSSLAGNNHIAFVYDSEGGTISTTIQLSQVEITSD